MNTRLTDRQRAERGLTRVYDFDVRATPICGRPGWFAVTSKRDRNRLYLTSRCQCSCPAGQSGDSHCCHRSLVRALTGDLIEKTFDEMEVAA